MDTRSPIAHSPIHAGPAFSLGSRTRPQAWVLGAAALALCGAQLVAAASARAAYPERPITMIVPTAPGGGNDAIARVLGQKLSTLMGQTVIVENKAGANGAIASEQVARSPADGYTILMGYIGTHGMNPALQALRYDPLKDFAPIGMIGHSPTVMVVNPKVRAGSVADLVAASKARPDELNYASAGNGTAPHFTAELFKVASGAHLMHIPYKGSGPAMADTMAGQTQVMFPSLFSAYPSIVNGKLRALAIAGPKRVAILPDVPTMAEAGIEGVEVTQWYALFAPANTPPAVVELLNKNMNLALADKEVVKRIEEQGAQVDTSTPQALRDTVKSEVAKWKVLVEQAHLSAD
ncbi:tripartite tricarboxylate transporter substrate binding protein [Alcaligenaceae bacterium A4P071]|nr:tripartite tricarboxylate transporter substrate binding protein [Alcaligenaceae bacterium A4P071]